MMDETYWDRARQAGLYWVGLAITDRPLWQRFCLFIGRVLLLVSGMWFIGQVLVLGSRCMGGKFRLFSCLVCFLFLFIKYCNGFEHKIVRGGFYLDSVRIDR